MQWICCARVAPGRSSVWSCPYRRLIRVLRALRILRAITAASVAIAVFSKVGKFTRVKASSFILTNEQLGSEVVVAALVDEPK